MRGVALYAKFRGSPYFLYTLCLYCAAMIAAHNFLGFDPNFGLFNLTLSMEASVSVAMLMMDREKADRQGELRQDHIAQIIDAIAAHDGLMQRRNSETDPTDAATAEALL